MNIFGQVITTSAAAFLVLAMAAQAQDATTDSDTGTSGTAANDLALGATDSAQPRVGETYIRETFSDWEHRCVLTETGNDPCQLYQLLRDSQGNSVAEMNIFQVPPGGPAAAGATVITPLETLLIEQVRLSVDGGQAKIYPFRFCTEIGCISRMGFTDEDIDTFRRGASAMIRIVPAAAPDQTVDLTMSLSGFTAGYEALIALTAE
ncbi:MAG: invasion associated locus B family protein [Boseongicola sp.]|nr:MAG: invasion associated locus B family protein [Boseongicola sp.]